MKLYRAKNSNRYFADDDGELFEVMPAAEFEAIDKVPEPPKKRATKARRPAATSRRKSRAEKAEVKTYECVKCLHQFESPLSYDELDCPSCGGSVVQI